MLNERTVDWPQPDWLDGGLAAEKTWQVGTDTAVESQSCGGEMEHRFGGFNCRDRVQQVVAEQRGYPVRG